MIRFCQIKITNIILFSTLNSKIDRKKNDDKKMIENRINSINLIRNFKTKCFKRRRYRALKYVSNILFFSISLLMTLYTNV